MKRCKKCGTILKHNQKFCPNCGTEVDEDNKREDLSKPILKCPNCGAEITSLTAVCPYCGKEINNANTCPTLKRFAFEINELDLKIANSDEKPKRGWKSWSTSQKIWWVIANFMFALLPLFVYYVVSIFTSSNETSFTKAEKEKASYIRNVTFPNDRETILEILLYINSQINDLSSEKIDKNTLKWISIWKNKADQVYKKAEILLGGDSIADNAYNEIIAKNKEAIRKYQLRSLLIIGAIILLFVYAYCTQNK